jgi:hypothetical protein
MKIVVAVKQVATPDEDFELDGLAVEEDAAGVGTVHPGEDLHQRRLPGAVLADQRVRLAGAQFQVRPAQGGDRTEVLAHVLQGQDDGACLRSGRGWRRGVVHGDRLQVMKRFIDAVAETIGTLVGMCQPSPRQRARTVTPGRARR